MVRPTTKYFPPGSLVLIFLAVTTNFIFSLSRKLMMIFFLCFFSSGDGTVGARDQHHGGRSPCPWAGDQRLCGRSPSPIARFFSGLNPQGTVPGVPDIDVGRSRSLWTHPGPHGPLDVEKPSKTFSFFFTSEKSSC